MPVKRRRDKRRAELDDDTMAWLTGEQRNFTQFLPHEKLVAIWEAYNDPTISYWDKSINTNPRPVSAIA